LKENRRRTPRHLRAVIRDKPPMEPRGCSLIDEGMELEAAL
jgi:hypothetical protein